LNIRKIAVFTGNRAEYGLQYPVLKAIEEHPNLDCQLIVSGAHLEGDFGNTLEEIKNDGFHIDAEVKIHFDVDSNISTAQAIGSGILSISEALSVLKPDVLVVYADRFEGFAAVIAATQMNIPTAHIEGGDLTEGGALDDSVRHAMSKLSHLHFTTNEQATKRLIGMGEEAWRVHTVGLPSNDLVADGEHANSNTIATKLNLDVNKPIVLFTQHSITTEFEKSLEQISPSLQALKNLAKEGVHVIVTYPNNDVGGRTIIEAIKSLDTESITGIQVHNSLGRYLYHGVLALAVDPSRKVVCVGNSSSGIKESPIFGCPTVNIGSRQKGRLRGDNVIDVDYNPAEIVNAVKKCLFDTDFRSDCHNTDNPYHIGMAGKAIAEVLANVELGKKIIRKGMTLVGESKDGWHR
jgi:UDP-N-acetylglucosamine 2-epimerase (non-hydrolysing)/GDP/UDP-N,N'-diacetylbacillosamine 2-epimerase (hydrolysing)